MGLISEELKIVSIGEIFKINLAIPEYQRPYTWQLKSANTLFNDIYEVFKESSFKKYRIGTIILHREEKDFNIVDGQQRITTFLLLFYAAQKICPTIYSDIESSMSIDKIKTLSYNRLSYLAIEENYNFFLKKISSFSEEELKNFISFVLNQCELVQVIIEDIKEPQNARQEAFQFFDSQNHRGKSLAPHDLLKSYHLREMYNENEEVKLKIISQWENSNQKELENLFEVYLFPITQWYKFKSGIGYSEKNIDSFKGIVISDKFNYTTYHKASNFYVEQINKTGEYPLFSNNPINQFQLTQPILAGKRFFDYVMHYKKMVNYTMNFVDRAFKKMLNVSLSEQDEKIKGLFPQYQSGDIYIYRLFICGVLFFADKFNFKEIDDLILKKMYAWAYSLRLNRYAVYRETVNKYALGNHSDLQNGNLFQFINEMKNPRDLELFELVDVQINKNYGDKSRENKLKSIIEFIESTREVKVKK